MVSLRNAVNLRIDEGEQSCWRGGWCLCDGRGRRLLRRGSLPGDVNPAGRRVERTRRAAVERDRRTRSVSPHQVDHLLEQLKLTAVPYAAADHDALPWPGTQGSGYNRRYVIAPVEAEQARLNAEAVLSEPGNSDLDRVGYGLGIPRTGDPVRIEPDDQDPGYQTCRVHIRKPTPHARPGFVAILLSIFVVIKRDIAARSRKLAGGDQVGDSIGHRGNPWLADHDQV
jgi:hypothetical protein